MQLEVTVPEVFEIFKEICLSHKLLDKMMLYLLQLVAEDYLLAVMGVDSPFGWKRKEITQSRRSHSTQRILSTQPRHAGLGAGQVHHPRKGRAQTRPRPRIRPTKMRRTITQHLSSRLRSGVGGLRLSLSSRRPLSPNLSQTEIRTANRALPATGEDDTPPTKPTKISATTSSMGTISTSGSPTEYRRWRSWWHRPKTPTREGLQGAKTTPTIPPPPSSRI